VAGRRPRKALIAANILQIDESTDTQVEPDPRVFFDE
jgi:hypothetical protein